MDGQSGCGLQIHISTRAHCVHANTCAHESIHHRSPSLGVGLIPHPNGSNMPPSNDSCCKVHPQAWGPIPGDCHRVISTPRTLMHTAAMPTTQAKRCGYPRSSGCCAATMLQFAASPIKTQDESTAKQCRSAATYAMPPLARPRIQQAHANWQWPYLSPGSMDLLHIARAYCTHLAKAHHFNEPGPLE
jgi:hypothetical protein